MAGMKTFLAKTWYIYGILSVLFLALCREVGWYAAANLAVFGGAAYLVHQASSRYKRLTENREVLQKMKPGQREKFLALDAREAASIVSTSKIMPYLCFGMLFLDGYTYYFNLTNHKSVAILPNFGNTAVSVTLLVLGLAFGVLFYFAWSLRMDQTRIDGAAIAKKKLKMK